VAWAGAYGVEPLSPKAMSPELMAAGFRIEGAGNDQEVVFDAE
jgi:hypothetical protein